MLKKARGRGARPKMAILAAGSMLLAGVGIANLTGAQAATKTTVSRVTCTALGGIITQRRDLNVTVTAPDTAAPGSTIDLVSKNVVTIPAGEPAPPAGTKVKQIKVYIPGNAAVASINNVSFSGGNFSGTWARDAAANELVLTLASNDPAGVDLAAVDTPQFTTNMTLLASASGAINFRVPPRMDLTVTSTIVSGDIVTNCVAADNSLVMATVNVTAPTTTTTAPTTTTTRATTSTSQATTTTRATTSTSQATTTTRATTSTSRATTTTRPATTTTRQSIDIFGALWKFLMCLLFGQCS